eukprot:CFRG3322T1
MSDDMPTPKLALTPTLASSNEQTYVCVECGDSVAFIYKEYSKGTIRLARCQRCGRIADKYCEFEALIIITDMLLHKPMVYRHLLYNRYGRESERWMLKLALLVLLCDAYIRCDVVYANMVHNETHPVVLVSFFLMAFAAALVGLISYCLTLIAIRRRCVSKKMIVSAMTLSSFPKLLIILQWVWSYKEVYFTWIIFALTVTSNVEALRVVQRCSYTYSLGLVVVGMCGTMAVQYFFYQVSGDRIWLVIV